MPLSVDVLAAARLVRLIRRDTIVAPVRERVVAAAYAGRDGVRLVNGSWQDTALMDANAPLVAELLRCSWCLGVWVAAGVALARRYAPGAWDPIANVLALSMLASVAEMTADLP